jgi:hypothetical protein
MFRIIRVPSALDQFFCTMNPHFRWDHWTYLRLLVLVIAVAWGRRHVANLDRYLDAPYHRSRFNNFFLVARWDPEAALRQKARELIQALHRQPGETVYLVIDDLKKAERGGGHGRRRKDATYNHRGLHAGASVCLCHPALP